MRDGRDKHRGDWRGHCEALALLFPIVLLGLGASCRAPGKRIRYQVNGEPGFSVFAVTLRGRAIITETSWQTVKVQATTSGPDGSFTLETPPSDWPYRMHIAISKPGYRAWLGEAYGPANSLGPDGREGNHFQLARAGSRGEELVATDGIASFSWMRRACGEGRWKGPCAAFERHVSERRRYLARRYPPAPVVPKIVGRELVSSWSLFRPGLALLAVVKVGTGTLVALEEYADAWYRERHKGFHLTFLRENPHLKKDPNLVVLDSNARVQAEVPLPGSAWDRPALAVVDERTVAVLGSKGALRLFDLPTRKLGEPIRLAGLKGHLLGLAAAPNGGPFLVAVHPNLLAQYDRQGRRLLAGPVPGIRQIQQVEVAPDGSGLLFGQQEGSFDYRGLSFGEYIKQGTPQGVVRVTASPQGWRATVLAHLVDALWVGAGGFWVFRKELVPASYHRLDRGEQKARLVSPHQQLFLYAFEGRLLRTLDVTHGTCTDAGVGAGAGAGAEANANGKLFGEALLTRGYLIDSSCGQLYLLDTAGPPP